MNKKMKKLLTLFSLFTLFAGMFAIIPTQAEARSMGHISRSSSRISSGGSRSFKSSSRPSSRSSVKSSSRSSSKSTSKPSSGSKSSSKPKASINKSKSKVNNGAKSKAFKSNDGKSVSEKGASAKPKTETKKSDTPKSSINKEKSKIDNDAKSKSVKSTDGKSISEKGASTPKSDNKSSVNKGTSRSNVYYAPTYRNGYDNLYRPYRSNSFMNTYLPLWLIMDHNNHQRAARNNIDLNEFNKEKKFVIVVETEKGEESGIIVTEKQYNAIKAGDQVEMKDGKLFVNDKELEK